MTVQKRIKIGSKVKFAFDGKTRNGEVISIKVDDLFTIEYFEAGKKEYRSFKFDKMPSLVSVS